jgi:predicted permease
LTAVEIALAVTLSVMALLMVRSVVSLRSVDLGFDPGGVAVARIALPEDRYPSEATQRVFFDRLLERVRLIHGVTAAGLVNIRPLGGLGPATTVTDPSNPPVAGTAAPVADVRISDAAAFHALRMPLVAGSSFNDTDPEDAAKAIVSRGLARAFWPRGNAIGRKLTLAMYGTLTAEVIGVVDDVHVMDPRTPVRPIVYLSSARFPGPVRDLIVRTDGASESAIPSLRAAVAGLDPSLPLYAVTTLPDLVDTTLAPERFTMYVLAVFAISALLLAAVGIFGVLGGDVTRRRREIGIRLALGATGSRLVVLLLRRSLLCAAAGVAAGMLLAVLLARLMTTLLFGVHPADPVSLAAVAGLVLVVATTATLIPALRAIRGTTWSVLREG